MADREIREATDSDQDGILETLRLALGETPLLRRTPALWEWKHLANPFGGSIVMIAEEGGVVAGVRALMRWDLATPTGNLVRCVRPVDTATHPAFTRRGIFRELTMTALEVARARDIDLVFNTPNQKSAPGYLDMGWQHVGWVGAQVRIRLGVSEQPSPTAAPSIEHLAPGLVPAGPVGDRVELRPPLGMRTPRTPDYLTWRFARHPTASYGWLETEDRRGGLVARASTRGSRTELVVSDLLGRSDPALIRELARLSRARYLAGWFSPGSPERSIATRGGLLPVPGLKTLRLVALPLDALEANPLDLESWDICTSDLELL